MRESTEALRLLIFTHLPIVYIQYQLGEIEKLSCKFKKTRNINTGNTKMILKELSAELIAAKKLEADAKAKRIEIERKIFDLAGQNANTNFHVNSMYSFEADPAALMMATMSWPAELQPAYLSPKLDETRLNKIRCEMPHLWQQIVQEVEIRYKPTGISLLISLE